MFDRSLLEKTVTVSILEFRTQSSSLAFRKVLALGGEFLVSQSLMWPLTSSGLSMCGQCAVGMD